MKKRRREGARTGRDAVRPGSQDVALDLTGAAPGKSVAERIKRGRDARMAVPRAFHGSWGPTADRPDPVAILERQATQRVPELVPIRHGRMAASPFAFYRGGAAIMAADLAPTPVSGITVQLCGDAHLMNFGAYASPDRRLMFDLNDFDETLPGPWEWDVKRLAASVTIATRELGYPAASVRRATIAAVQGYRVRMQELAGRTDLATWYSRIDVERLLEALSEGKLRAEVREMIAAASVRDHFRSLAKLTELRDGHRRFVDEPPVLAHIDDPATLETLREVFGRYPQSLTRDRRELYSRYTLVDIAHKVVGVGSVGLTAFVALFLGRDDHDPLFLQLKEARRSALEDYLPRSRTGTAGQRVVDGQKLMQAASDIFLGYVQVPGRRQFYVRQLTDMKWSADLATMSRKGLGLYVWLCGEALARAHARSGDRIAIAAYLGGGGRFEEAMADFAAAYADQNERDYGAFLAAIASGRIHARTV
jgi:uncharacterized protein (DUF2252 family)